MNPEALPMEQQRAEQACEALRQRINADEREERAISTMGGLDSLQGL